MLGYAVKLAILLLMFGALSGEDLSIGGVRIPAPFKHKTLPIEKYNHMFPGVEDPMILMQDESGHAVLSFSEVVDVGELPVSDIRDIAADALIRKYPNAKGVSVQIVNNGGIEMIRAEYLNTWSDVEYKTIAVVMVHNKTLTYITVRVVANSYEKFHDSINASISGVSLTNH